MKGNLWLPPGYRWRELYLPESIVSSTLPNSVYDGHPQTLQNQAAKRTTADGVSFDKLSGGGLGSGIDCGAIHNAAAKLWISLRFKLDQDLTGVSDYIWGKALNIANDYLLINLDGVNNMVRLIKKDGGIEAFDFNVPVAGGFKAHTWYHILASISSVNAARLRLNGGTAGTDADVSAVCNGGTIWLGEADTPGGLGISGVIAEVVQGTDDLLPAEEVELSKGIPPSDAVNLWTMDEGRGPTIYDRGSGADNGTLTRCGWSFGRVKEVCGSLDGINDYFSSSAGVNIAGALSLVVVVKAKSTYNGLAADHYLAHAYIDANNELRIYYANAADALRFHAEGGGTAQTVDYSTRPAIDDYLILILTLAGGTTLGAYVNGTLVGTASGVGEIAGGQATLYTGAEQTPGDYDVSKPLLVGLIDSALTLTEVKALSRMLNKRLDLGLTI